LSKQAGSISIQYFKTLLAGLLTPSRGQKTFTCSSGSSDEDIFILRDVFTISKAVDLIFMSGY
jgi:hypothetical protein